MAELSFRIDELMQEKSQSEGRAVTFYAIAKETGLSHQRIKAYADNALVRFDKRALEAFATYFDCTVGDLFRYKKSG